MSYATSAADRQFASDWNEMMSGVLEERQNRVAREDGQPLRGYCWNCDEAASANLAVVITVRRSDGEKRRAFYPVCSMRCHAEFTTKL